MIVAILQARMSSSRLPGKVLKPILGKPMLSYELERIKSSKLINKIVVATSTDHRDDPIQLFCEENSVDVYRGSLNDVLDRYYHAAKKYNADHIVRLTGDCPLHDPELIDEMIEKYIEKGCDFLTNTIEPTFPDGLDVWVFSFKTLEMAWKEAVLTSEREHVCTWMIAHPERVSTFSFKAEDNHSSLRWTVDEQDDFEFVKIIYEELYKRNHIFNKGEILALLAKKTSISMINKGHIRDEGLAKSLFRDRQVKMENSGLKIEKSLQMQKKARSLIPGMVQLLSKRVDQFSDGVWPGYFKKAKGVDVWDLDDNQYIDMSIGGIGATILGYADDEIDESVMLSIKNGVSCSLNCPEEVELAELLVSLHPWAGKVRFTRSGGESMAVAIRIARAFTKRDEIAFCGYHGWHDWYLSANLSSDSQLDGHLLPGLQPLGVPRGLAGTLHPFRYNQLQELEQIVQHRGKQIAVIVMEPIRNDNPEKGFLEGVREIANKVGAVLIIDEITSAFRLNGGGAHLLYGLQPDIAVFAKAIGNGYPIGAIIGRSEIMDSAQSTFISSTNWTERIGPTAALATIKKHLRLNSHNHLIKCGERVQKGWIDCARKNDIAIEVGGIAPLSHFVFRHEKHLSLKALFIQHMLERGFLASNIFYAMHAHCQWHIDVYLEAVDEAFLKIRNAIADNSVERQLKGKPAASGFRRLN